MSAGVHSRIGEIAVRKGWSEADQVAGALKTQAGQEIDHADAGEILVSLGWLTSSQLEEARRRCGRTSEKVEEALIELRLPPRSRCARP